VTSKWLSIGLLLIGCPALAETLRSATSPGRASQPEYDGTPHIAVLQGSPAGDAELHLRGFSVPAAKTLRTDLRFERTVHGVYKDQTHGKRAKGTPCLPPPP
jgi:hypothetical protein